MFYTHRLQSLYRDVVCTFIVAQMLFDEELDRLPTGLGTSGTATTVLSSIALYATGVLRSTNHSTGDAPSPPLPPTGPD